jgi:hypothetical protein
VGPDAERRHDDRDEDLVRTHGGVSAADEEVVDRDAALSGGPVQFDGRVEGGDDGGPVGSDVGGGEGAAEGAAVADERVADEPGGGGQQRHGGQHGAMVFDLAVGGHRADPDGAAVDGDAAQLRNPVDVDQDARAGVAQLHGRQQRVAAGEQGGVGGVPGEQLQGFGEVGGPVVVERRGDHAGSLSVVVWMARQIVSAVRGMSRWVIPNGESASSTALTTAGGVAMLPASPIPLTPSGLSGVGVTV